MHGQGFDPYEVLGLEGDASPEDIRTAFRRLAFRCHPDRNPGDPHAEERFKRVTDAFQLLDNPASKAAWDRQRRAKGNGDAERRDPFDMLARQFSQVFGAEPPDEARPQDDDLVSVRVGFLQAALGATLQTSVERAQPCAECDGLGVAAEENARTCPRCGGAGSLPARLGCADVAVRCRQCRGLGRAPWRECASCLGVGRLSVWEQAKACVPPGAATGQLLSLRTFSGREVTAVLEVEPHEFFRRDGADLVVRVRASMSLAMRGGALSVPGLDEELRVEVPAGLRPGQRLRIAGHGLPRSDGDGRGDLVAEVELSDPRHAGLRRLLQEFVDPSSGASGE